MLSLQGEEAPMSMATKAKWVAIALLLSLSLAVLIQNTSPAEVKILFVSVSMPLTVLLGIVLLVGYILGSLSVLLWFLKRNPLDETLPVMPQSAEESLQSPAGEGEAPAVLGHQRSASPPEETGPDEKI